MSSAINEFWRDIDSRYRMQGGDPDRPLVAPTQMFVPAEEFYLRAKELDRDGDGKLSPEEFPGPPGLFDRLDTDSDGKLSPAEAEAPPRIAQFAAEKYLGPSVAVERPLSPTLPIAPRA